ncbi:hypothetical protein A2W45_03840 [Candidatus Curtissbacteria bacterium RIFCSPHIGHO2_12_41_11]|uniref:Uncharacterized protein n=3 Tax=Candidatus Curtissiibacteriota TaxID=1752717 RepID=A0A1F5HQ41_9BACT|nr:MAG: hypothetical protein A2Z54_01195 [Candidatus Curtissbacteria bacterium RIFCSPHIGHO2_02_39_8]OGD98389.1 MAG: hypothetical protein A2W45_03840 [Candidatus Curtissbacteria bacterium RIFCSPHIGHO2_12_41_11]OGE06264.1 MAG: hypothetical protein A2W70_00300 [Candidatus Curtissbacteria bacterium RIFCSPLOWO2_02_41_11]
MSRIEMQPYRQLSRELSRRRLLKLTGGAAAAAVVGVGIFSGIEGPMKWIESTFGFSSSMEGKPVEGAKEGIYIVRPNVGEYAIARSIYHASDDDKTQLGYLKVDTKLQGILVNGDSYPSPYFDDYNHFINGRYYGEWLEATSLDGARIPIYERDNLGNLVPKIGKDGQAVTVEKVYTSHNFVEELAADSQH